jgi:hypothetical protein
MVFCNAFQIDTPDTFPLAEWEQFLTYGAAVAAADNVAGGEFVRAMGAVAFRYRAADEALSSMIEDWVAGGRALSFEAMYRQQRDLFEFFSCSLSSIESALYACYIVLTQRHPTVAPWSNVGARRGYFDRTLPGLLRAAFQTGHSLEATISALAASSAWTETTGFRNSLIHRALPSRLVEGSMDGTPPPLVMVKYAASWSNPELRATDVQMQHRLQWVANQLALIFSQAATL